jgi:hypothetical protein
LLFHCECGGGFGGRSGCDITEAAGLGWPLGLHLRSGSGCGYRAKPGARGLNRLRSMCDTRGAGIEAGVERPVVASLPPIRLRGGGPEARGRHQPWFFGSDGWLRRNGES